MKRRRGQPLLGAEPHNALPAGLLTLNYLSPISLAIRTPGLRHRLVLRMSLDESYPGIQPTTGRKAGDLLTFTTSQTLCMVGPGRYTRSAAPLSTCRDSTIIRCGTPLIRFRPKSGTRFSRICVTTTLSHPDYRRRLQTLSHSCQVSSRRSRTIWSATLGIWRMTERSKNPQSNDRHSRCSRCHL